MAASSARRVSTSEGLALLLRTRSITAPMMKPNTAKPSAVSIFEAINPSAKPAPASSHFI